MNIPGWTWGGRGPGRRILWAAAAVLVLAATTPAAAGAQEATMDDGAPRMRPPTVEVTGSVGVLLPLSELASQGDTLKAELSTAPTFSAGLDVWFAESLGLSLMGGYASPDLIVTSADASTGMQNAAQIGNADVLHGEALLVWRPLLGDSRSILLPYVGAGLGYRHVSFDLAAFDNATDLGGVVDLGARVWISDSVHLRFDVRDLITSYQGGPFEQSNIQHDVLTHVGVGIGF